MIKLKNNKMARSSCEHCPDAGTCCRYFHELVVGVLLTDEEALRFPEAIATGIGFFLPLKSGTGECLFLDARGRCTLKESRKPEICRSWHCVHDFGGQGEPSRFLLEHPQILSWVRTMNVRTTEITLKSE
ncbi:MAG: hypothetical protein JSU72_17220, partial [Deltaproteobacteria bacterium]